MMKRLVLISILSLLLLFSCQHKNDRVSGHLVLIGGGKRPADIMQKFVDLSGGDSARIAIIPMASGYYTEVGPEYVQEMKKLGAAEAKAFYPRNSLEANADSVLAIPENFTGVFFSGGDQNKLTAIFNGTTFLQNLKTAYKNGLVIGGTSAGTAVMSRIMITGDGNWQYPFSDSVKTTNGFGVVQNDILDQHFFKRSRLNRLLVTVLANHANGIGIDESTALWIHDGNQATVLGKSIVIRMDVRSADIPDNISNTPLSGRNIKLNVYKMGDMFYLN